MSSTPVGGRLDGLTNGSADWSGLRVVVAGLGVSGFAAADALGGAVPLRLVGALAAVLTVLMSGVLGRVAAPERRSAPLLTAGTAAVCVATPLFGGTVVNGELLGLPFLVIGIRWPTPRRGSIRSRGHRPLRCEFHSEAGPRRRCFPVCTGWKRSEGRVSHPFVTLH